VQEPILGFVRGGDNGEEVDSSIDRYDGEGFNTQPARLAGSRAVVGFKLGRERVVKKKRLVVMTLGQDVVLQHYVGDLLEAPATALLLIIVATAAVPTRGLKKPRVGVQMRVDIRQRQLGVTPEPLLVVVLREPAVVDGEERDVMVLVEVLDCVLFKLDMLVNCYDYPITILREPQRIRMLSRSPLRYQTHLEDLYEGRERLVSLQLFPNSLRLVCKRVVVVLILVHSGQILRARGERLNEVVSGVENPLRGFEEVVDAPQRRSDCRKRKEGECERVREPHCNIQSL
jgi:hypothetical protein